MTTIPEIISEMKNKKLIILVDSKDRENEGDLVFPAQFITPQIVNFMALHARGLICVSLDKESAQRMGLPQMVENNSSPQKTAFTVSVEAASGVSTGISAADRSRTIQVLSDPTSKPQDLARPGHIFPIQAQEGGVLKRAGHTEASVDLCQLSGLRSAAVICEIMNLDGTMARLPQLETFSKQHGIKIGSIEDLIHYKKQVTLKTSSNE